MIERTSKWGNTITVDDEDADLLPDVCRIKRPNSYVNVKDGGAMHRVIMSRILGRELLDTEKVDHRNLNKMDNRRSNLRLATHAQNSTNMGKRRFFKNLYKGIHQQSRTSWTSKIKAQGKVMNLGLFDTPLEAHKQYCIAALKYQAPFHNFGANSPFLGWTLEMFEQPIVQLSLPIKEAA